MKPLAVIVVVAMAAACSDAPTSTTTPSTTPTTAQTTATAPEATEVDASLPWPAEPSDEHQRWTIQIVGQVPHDSDAFTQGLEYVDGELLESSGRYGESTIRRVADDGSVDVSIDLDSEFFGEGLTVVGDRIIQLTWRSETALVWEYPSLLRSADLRYDGEGWGLCHDGVSLWMSNGTSTLTQRDPDSFDPIGSVVVQRNGTEIHDLNELECIGQYVLANVWHSDEIVMIEPGTGSVVATIDASELVRQTAAADPQAVLNGIADVGDGTLLLGGKLWPSFYLVRLVTNE